MPESPDGMGGRKFVYAPIIGTADSRCISHPAHFDVVGCSPVNDPRSPGQHE